MTLAIMQPYFLPYIGYWQLLNVVDEFVIYDNIQYTKKGWINRNRYLLDGKDRLFTIQLEKSSDYLNICDKRISAQFDSTKVLNQIHSAYHNAPYFDDVYNLLHRILCFPSTNLFEFIQYSITQIAIKLNITTKIICSSSLPIDHDLRSPDKLYSICNSIGAKRYINPQGGQTLYDKSEFRKHGIDLFFLMPDNISYRQFEHEFVPSLSIVDILMFNSLEEITQMLTQFKLL